MNNSKWLLQVCNKSVALDWTKILSYWSYTHSGMEHLKVNMFCFPTFSKDQLSPS